ncbi:hypothetical protein QVG61_05500 [Thiohalobacter sp. IOR34]|uniref:hypothetical protein n=1 Tax=Thiohalobacter sp. IOR34 TaxID=3057176 RepID=UPI0025B0BAB9|nr:hypothetical protein [Thiohalobacter sp. IOR34]WJW76544.1 hypothetical protein QVG61_05500 [Thiohalobacter sp. IOR34]
MTPGQKAGGDIAASERLQPLIDNYPIWLAARFIPDYFDDEMVRRYVIKELDKARRFYREYRGRGPDKPWLSKAEVKDRNPELAAPEFMDRYKALIRDFTNGLSTRLRVYYQIGAPNYNVKTGRMQFGPSKEQTNLAWQVTPSEHNSRGYIAFRQQFGAEIANRAAEKTAGYRLGLLSTHQGDDVRIRLAPETYVPLILRSVGKPAASRLPIYLALDRDLITQGLPMSQRDAERFLNKYANRSNASVRIDIRVKDAVRLRRVLRGRPVAEEVLILVADVESLSLHSPPRPVRVNGVPTAKSELVARYAAADLPPASDTLAQQRAAYEKQHQQAAREAEEAKRSLASGIEAKTRECEASGAPQCWGELCKAIARQGDRNKLAWCTEKRKQSMLAYGKAMKQQRMQAMQQSAREIMAAKAPPGTAKQAAIPAHCRSRYSGRNAAPWYPHSGSAEYDAALQACSKERVRKPYGPDILGLRLGMRVNDALPLLQRQQMSRRATSNDARPFHEASLEWNRKGDHGIALFYLFNGEFKRLAAVSRRLYLDDKAMGIEQVRDGLRKKYGRELWTGKGEAGSMLWAFAGQDGGADAKACAGLVELLEERAGWSREWEAPRSSRSTRSSAGSASANDIKQQCFAEAGITLGGMPAMDMGKMMALQRCMQEKAGKMIPGADPAEKDKQTARLPLMVDKGGEAARYARFRNCGPTIIARFKNGEDGKLQDLSLLLLDPAWLAEQPGFMFDAAGVAEGGAGIQF